MSRHVRHEHQRVSPKGKPHTVREHEVNRENSGASTIWRPGTEPDMCYPGKCPRCGAPVFFVRHNGGSVWFDELGQPWPKHPCFGDTVPLDACPEPLPSDDALSVDGVIRRVEVVPGRPPKLSIACGATRTVAGYTDWSGDPEAIVGCPVTVVLGATSSSKFWLWRFSEGECEDIRILQVTSQRGRFRPPEEEEGMPDLDDHQALRKRLEKRCRKGS